MVNIGVISLLAIHVSAREGEVTANGTLKTLPCDERITLELYTSQDALSHISTPLTPKNSAARNNEP